VTFTELLHTSAQNVGLTPGVTLTNDIAAQFASYISRALRETARAFQWPILNVIEERRFRADWASGTTYALRDEVWSVAQGAYYRSLLASNTNHAVTDTAWWTPAANLARWFALGSFEAVFTIHDEDPRGKINPTRRGFELTGGNVVVGESAPNSVWATGRAAVNGVTTTAYSAATAYAVGSIVYHTDGDCYVCILASTGNVPTNATYWKKVLIPDAWTSLLSYRAAADYDRADGNIDRAREFDADARRELQAAMADIAHNQTQTVRYEQATQ
jgi:hypothetical protein